MARKAVTTVREICAKVGVNPARYLATRMHTLQRGTDAQKKEAEKIALELLPYTQRKLAPIPADAVKEALQEGRLVVLGISTETE